MYTILDRTNKCECLLGLQHFDAPIVLIVHDALEEDFTRVSGDTVQYSF